MALLRSRLAERPLTQPSSLLVSESKAGSHVLTLAAKHSGVAMTWEFLLTVHWPELVTWPQPVTGPGSERLSCNRVSWVQSSDTRYPGGCSLCLPADVLTSLFSSRPPGGRLPWGCVTLESTARVRDVRAELKWRSPAQSRLSPFLPMTLGASRRRSGPQVPHLRGGCDHSTRSDLLRDEG